MILIGQFDSPFVRRIGIAMRLYGLPFEHRPWSVFGDAEKLRAFNPLTRVPTLVLDDGEVLVESGAILDHLDETVGRDRALVPASGLARRHQMFITSLATGIADKAVSLFYERALHPTVSDVWADRCRVQIGAVLDALEADRGPAWWFGTSPGHADIAVACALRFAGEAHPGVLDLALWPKLASHAAACEAMAVFQEIAQAFAPPA